MHRRYSLIPLLWLAGVCAGWMPSAPAADQTGAEEKKKPVSAEIVAPEGGGKDDGRFGRIGNVQVVYDDGSRDLWTAKGNCSQPRVAADGTVGWTVCEAERPAVNASNPVRPNGLLVVCRKGQVIARINSGKAFIENWDFTEGGARLALLTRALHGPAEIELHESALGTLVDRTPASKTDLPDWAKPYAQPVAKP